MRYTFGNLYKGVKKIGIKGIQGITGLMGADLLKQSDKWLHKEIEKVLGDFFSNDYSQDNREKFNKEIETILGGHRWNLSEIIKDMSDSEEKTKTEKELDQKIKDLESKMSVYLAYSEYLRDNEDIIGARVYFLELYKTFKYISNNLPKKEKTGSETSIRSWLNGIYKEVIPTIIYNLNLLDFYKFELKRALENNTATDEEKVILFENILKVKADIDKAIPDLDIQGKISKLIENISKENSQIGDWYNDLYNSLKDAINNISEDLNEDKVLEILLDKSKTTGKRSSELLSLGQDAWGKLPKVPPPILDTNTDIAVYKGQTTPHKSTVVSSTQHAANIVRAPQTSSSALARQDIGDLNIRQTQLVNKIIGGNRRENNVPSKTPHLSDLIQNIGESQNITDLDLYGINYNYEEGSGMWDILEWIKRRDYINTEIKQEICHKLVNFVNTPNLNTAKVLFYPLSKYGYEVSGLLVWLLEYRVVDKDKLIHTIMELCKDLSVPIENRDNIDKSIENGKVNFLLEISSQFLFWIKEGDGDIRESIPNNILYSIKDIILQHKDNEKLRNIWIEGIIRHINKIRNPHKQPDFKKEKERYFASILKIILEILLDKKVSANKDAIKNKDGYFDGAIKIFNNDQKGALRNILMFIRNDPYLKGKKEELDIIYSFLDKYLSDIETVNASEYQRRIDKDEDKDKGFDYGHNAQIVDKSVDNSENI